jgi:hypothetical protein
MRTESQLNRIKKHLQAGKSISPMIALREFGCLRLAARISDLKEQGMRIKTVMIYNASPAYKYAKYSLQK